MSFLKEIITKLESIPGSEKIIERIMALVDGDIEKDIDVTVMQEITKILEEETAFGAEVASDESVIVAASDVEGESETSFDDWGGWYEPEDEAADTSGDEGARSFQSDESQVDPFLYDWQEEVTDTNPDTSEKSDGEWLGWDEPEDEAADTSSDEGSADDAAEGDDTEVFPTDESTAEQTEGSEETTAEEETPVDERISSSSDESAEDEEDRLYKQAIYLIKKMLDNKEYSYTESSSSEDVHIIKMGVRYDYCRLSAEIFVEKDPLVCFVRINLPIACDPIYFPVLSEHLAALNRKNSRYGAYALDLEDGSVECRFRLRYDDGLGIKAFQKMLFFALGDADDEYPEISRLSAGKLKRDKREETVKKAKALIADIEEE